jgi:hypothetical protein
MKHLSEIVSVLFLSREQAHRAHLKTKSYAQHVALGDFYDAVVDLADNFAEVSQGTYGLLPDIPYKPPVKGAIDDVLEELLECVEDCRGKFDKPCDGPLLNILDEIGALFAKTLYKLRNLS